jgi:formate hydrogenlyase subunit 6/NADH:ubiquinone oxidoreductase subunit I
MNLGAMLSDVLGSFFKKNATRQYPLNKIPAPDRLRGKLVWDPAKCTGCQLCIKDCPSNAIELIVVDKVSKRFVMRYHADRCTYCAQCVVDCRFKCLNMSSTQWELASAKKEPFTVYYGKDADIDALLAKAAAPCSSAASEG